MRKNLLLGLVVKRVQVYCICVLHEVLQQSHILFPYKCSLKVSGHGRLHFRLQDIEYMIKFTLRNLLIGIDHANTLKS